MIADIQSVFPGKPSRANFETKTASRYGQIYRDQFIIHGIGGSLSNKVNIKRFILDYNKFDG